MRRVGRTGLVGTPFGANVINGGVDFRVWAPKAERVNVEIQNVGGAQVRKLTRARDGVFAGRVPGAGPGVRYRFRLDGGSTYPDPWSRSQPEGVHGPSQVVDLDSFKWTDAGWTGVERDRLVIYEVHVGTYTREGTFEALSRELPEIKRLGVTAIELMPVAEFPGRWNWGYDGVGLFAPSHCYGGAADLQGLVDTAHREGLAVFLDVVYNHLGPDGNYLGVYSDDYFTKLHATPWGDAINFDGPNCHRVRELVIENACYWLAGYHLDGLRLDATHEIFDDSPTSVLAELSDAVHARVGSARQVHLVAEDARNEVALIRPRAQGGFGFNCVWADDFHHAVHTMLTGEREGYYLDYDGSARAVADAIVKGFIYQGDHSEFRASPRGTPVTDEPAGAFIFCIQNHDQIGNRALGERLHHLTGTDAYAVASVLLLLAPETPLLFMGQEFAASSPFLYFTDHRFTLGRLVTGGRRREFAHFSAFRDPESRERIPDPQAEETFLRSKLNLAERALHAGTYELYRRLLELRRTDPVFTQSDRQSTRALAIGDRCVVVERWVGSLRRLIVANFGSALDFDLKDDQLLGGLDSTCWTVILSTSESRFTASEIPQDGPVLSIQEAGPARDVPRRIADNVEHGNSGDPRACRANVLPALQATSLQGGVESIHVGRRNVTARGRIQTGSSRPVALDGELVDSSLHVPAMTAIILGLNADD